MSDHPLSVFDLPRARSVDKPRRRGLTMMVDAGVPIRYLEDLLALAGGFVDLAKLLGSTARIYPMEILQAKLSLYRSHGIKPFLGGQFTEAMYMRGGVEAASAYFDAARAIGISAVEVSDTYDPIPASDRKQLILKAKTAGLEVHGEVGAKEARGQPAVLIDQAKECFELGCDVVAVEAGELSGPEGLNKDMVAVIAAGLDIDRLLFELPGPWLPGTTISVIHGLMRQLVAAFGPDVNIANVPSDSVFMLEAIRCGLTGRPVVEA